MTRIKVLTREEMNAEQRAAFDDAKAAGAPTGGPYTAYIRMPKLMRATREVSDILRGSALTGRERQMAVLIAIRHWDANYPWAVQVRASLAAGLDQATIDAINARQRPALTDARERAAYDVATELLTSHRMTDATYANADKLFGTGTLVALVAAVGYFSMVANTANAFDVTPPDDAPARLMG